MLYTPVMSRMVWLKTRKQFLLREKNSGRYYARLFADGKQHWFSLKTDVFAVAEAKLAEKIKEFRKANKPPKTVEQGKATVEQLAQAYLATRSCEPTSKRALCIIASNAVI